MSKKGLIAVLLIVLSLLTLTGVGLTTYFLLTPDRADIIDLKLETSESESITFQNLGMNPGEACEYTIALFSEVKDDYDVTLAFSENEDLTLKNYVYAKIETEDEVVYDDLLANLFEEGELALVCPLSDREPYHLKITYYMPAEVGNEAQNAEADFDLSITASNVGDFYE